MDNKTIHIKGLVLAAGKGTRFQSGHPMPKVLQPVLGKPMIFYVLDSLREAGIEDVTLVVGFGAKEVMRTIGSRYHYVHQQEQQGSGHAVMCAREHFSGFSGSLVVMCGDSPLFSSFTICNIIDEHVRTGASITLAVTVLENPFGYGRILRDASGSIIGIVEEKCASVEEQSIKEVNGGAYVFDAKWLFENIYLMTRNQAGEYNLTDMIRVAAEQNLRVSAVQCNPKELLGVNTPEQLTLVEEILKGKRCEWSNVEN